MSLRMFVCMSTSYAHVEFNPVLEKLNNVVRSLYSSLTVTGYLRLDESQFAERIFGRILLLGESVDL